MVDRLDLDVPQGTCPDRHVTGACQQVRVTSRSEPELALTNTKYDENKETLAHN